jgi:hypothetical protein
MLSMKSASEVLSRNRSLAPLKEALSLAGGISDSTRRRITDFPCPVVLSRTRSGRPCRIAFVREEVLAWCEARIAADRATGAEAS